MIRKQMSKILAASAIMCAATGVSVVNAAELEVNNIQTQAVEGRSTSTVGTVTGCPSGLNLRKNANTNSSILRLLPNGAKVNILSTSNGWHKVEYNNIYGYVSATYIKTSSTSSGETTMSSTGTIYNTNGEGVNLRKSASTSSAIVTGLQEGTKLTITAKNGDWYKVKVGSYTGYVYSKYVKVTTSNSNNNSNSSSGETTMSSAGTVYNTNGEGVNLRKSASTSSAIVTGLQEGAAVTITAKNGDWYKVKYGSYTGYVYSKYVKVGSSAGNSNNNSNSSSGETTMSSAGTVYNTNGEGVNLRKSASTSSAIVTGLQEGAAVTITAKNGDWYKVKYGSYTGYVYSKYVKVGSSAGNSNSSSGETTMSSTGTIYNTNGEGVNLRKSASTSSAIVTGLQEGAAVTITAKNGDWYKVKYGSYTGYVYSKYVKVGSSAGNSNNNSNNNNYNGDVAFSSKAYIGETGNEGLNLRKSPSTNSSIITIIPQGATVTVTAKNGDWYKVTYAGNTGYAHSSYVVLGDKPSIPENNTSATFESVYNVMKAHLGSPYVWGGSGEFITDSSIASLKNKFPNEAAQGKYDMIDRKFYNSGYRAFDCSGLMQWGFAQVGISIGRTTYNQVNDGYAVSKANAQPGDLLITNSQGHVGMYIGDGKWIESPYSGAYIRISNVNWSNIGYVRRVL